MPHERQTGARELSRLDSELLLGKVSTPRLTYLERKSSVSNIPLDFVSYNALSEEDSLAVTCSMEDKYREDAATLIQTFFRKTLLKRLRRYIENRVKKSLQAIRERALTLEYEMNQNATVTSDLFGLSSGMVYWLVRNKGYKSITPPAIYSGQGAVVSIYFPGLTQFTQQLDRRNSPSIEIPTFAFNDGQLNNRRLKPFDNLIVTQPQHDAVQNSSGEVLSQIHKAVTKQALYFQGDIIKYLSDKVQILFPMDVLFNRRSKKENEPPSKTCQNRALLFALELMETFDSLEVQENVFAKDHMSLKVGVAFGDFSLFILGSKTRKEVILWGETQTVAESLSERALDFEILVHKSIEEISKRIVLSGTFVRLRMDNTEPETLDLYERLRTSKDYVNLSQQDNPYYKSPKSSQQAHTPSFLNFAKVEGYSLSQSAINRMNSEDSVSFYDRDSSKKIFQENSTRSILSEHSELFEEELLQLLAITSFIPKSVFIKSALGQFLPQIDGAFFSIATFIVPIETSSTPNHLVLYQIQDIFMAILGIVQDHVGEIATAYVDNRGLVMQTIHGDWCTKPEIMSISTVLKVLHFMNSSKHNIAVGVASGFCRAGLLGESSRHNYCLTGKASDLSMKFASRAASPFRFISWNHAIALIDQSTFLGLPRYLKQIFAVGSVFMQGFEDNIQVFLPLASNSFEPSPHEKEVFIELAFLEEIKCVRAGDLPIPPDGPVRWQRMESGAVLNVSKLALVFEHSEAIQAVLKSIAVMSTVSARIDILIIETIFSGTGVHLHLKETLHVLCSRMQLVRSLSSRLYMVNQIESRIRPLYDSLTPAFRKQVHEQLGNAYNQHIKDESLKDLPESMLYLFVASHYEKAGTEKRLQGATILNQSLPEYLKEDPHTGVQIGKRSFSMAKSWQQSQQARAELVSADAQFSIAKAQRKSQMLLLSFSSFVGVLRSFLALEPLLQARCVTTKTCCYYNDTIETCSCQELSSGFKVYLFIHSAQDRYSDFQFRCLKVSLTRTSFFIKPVDCIPHHFMPEVKEQYTNCDMHLVTPQFVKERYTIPGDLKDHSKTPLYLLSIRNRRSGHFIIRSFYYLGEISLKLKAIEFARATVDRNNSTVYSSVTEAAASQKQHQKPKIVSSACIVQ